MTLMAEEDPRSDMNFVVISVPLSAMQMLDENATAVVLQHGNKLPWLTLVLFVLIGRFVGKKFHLSTKQLLGSILVAVIFSTFVQPFEPAPKLLMAVVQLNIGLYIGTKLEKDRLLKLRSTLPNLFFADNGVFGNGTGRHCGNVFGGLEHGRGRPAYFDVPAVPELLVAFCD